MMQHIDARGRACPEPVVLTRKALKENSAGISIMVDNECAVENITRYASNNGYAVAHSQEGADHLLTLNKK